MKIMNQKVNHKKYGAGTIFAFKDNKVYVSFGKLFGEKNFPYPEVFRNDMKLVDEDSQEEVDEEIARKDKLGK